MTKRLSQRAERFAFGFLGRHQGEPVTFSALVRAAPEGITERNLSHGLARLSRAGHARRSRHKVQGYYRWCLTPAGVARWAENEAFKAARHNGLDTADPMV